MLALTKASRCEWKFTFEFGRPGENINKMAAICGPEKTTQYTVPKKNLLEIRAVNFSYELAAIKIVPKKMSVTPLLYLLYPDNKYAE